MLKNKTALVMGGKGSIGSAISQSFENKGARVIRHGAKGEFSVDVRDSSQLKKFMSSIISQFGGVDILVNSVSAPIKIGSLEKKDWNDFIAHFEVQLKSIVETTQLVLPKMKEKKFGRIINIISSYAVGQPPSGLSEYVTAKYAVLGLTKSLAKELARYKITVNAISPSFIDNNFSAVCPGKMVEILTAQNPLGRLVNPNDVANVAIFLALPENDFITGENILLCGGEQMR